MITVYTNWENYQYELHALVKAFYPAAEVRVSKSMSLEKYSLGQYLASCQNGVLEAGAADRIIVYFGSHKLEIYFDVSLSNEANAVRGTDFYVDNFEQIDGKIEKSNYTLSLYHALCEYTGRSLPWGNLTGIRPTKLAMGMLAEGMSDSEIIGQLKSTHAVSNEKAKLSLDIAKRERKILNQIHYKDGYSLYIGIPFCPTTCLYCSFTSYPIAAWRKRIQDYLQALFQEIDFTEKCYHDKILDTVYIGGGTPTTLEAEALDQLLGKIRDTFDFSHVKEFTVEAGRADSITAEKLAVLKKHGVTRISVNPQTMKEETLRIIGRQHTVAQVKEAFYLVREAGFDNINMDIILGLPGELEEDVQHTIEEIKKLNPDNFTVHSLAVKRASNLGQWIAENGIETLRNTDATMEIASKGARDMGMEPYYLYRQKNMSGNFENVGYAKAGKYGIYNILIMEEVQTIVALGAGSISKRVYPDGRIERCENVKDVALYIEKIDEMIERKRKLLRYPTSTLREC